MAAATPGPGGGFPIGGGGLGIGSIIVLGLLGWALGIDPRLLIGGAEILTGGQQQQEAPYSNPRRRPATPTDDTGKFVSAVLGSTEVTWKDIFEKEGQTYRAPRLVIFSNATSSACGYCAERDGSVLLPDRAARCISTPSFFRDLERRFRGCSGEACKFAQAYVIAHEVGHHVQNLLGILPQGAAGAARGRLPR